MNEKNESKFLILFNPLIMYGCQNEIELRKQFMYAKLICIFLSVGLACILGFYLSYLNILLSKKLEYNSISEYIGYVLSIPLSFLFGFYIYNNIYVKRVFIAPSYAQKLHILKILNEKQDKLLYLFFLLDDSIISWEKKNIVLSEPYSDNAFDILFHAWHKTIYVCVYRD